MSDPRGYLMPIFNEMLRKAYSPKNLAKGDWHDMTDEQVRQRIRDEAHELLRALDDPNTGIVPILSECADVAAFGGILADPDRGDPDAPRVPDLYGAIVNHSIEHAGEC